MYIKFLRFLCYLPQAVKIQEYIICDNLCTVYNNIDVNFKYIFI